MPAVGDTTGVLEQDAGISHVSHYLKSNSK
jgi:hypothetical protein